MRWLSLLLSAWIGLAAAQGSVELAGARFEERVRIGESEAVLNGAGLRGILGLHFYAIGVYLPQRQGRAIEALRVPGAKRIRVVNLFGLSGELVGNGLVKTVRRNLGDGEFAELKARIEALRAIVRAIDHAAAGSAIELDWLPAPGGGGVTRLSINGQQRGEDIPGEDFFQALLKVWLGEKVNDARLRDALLGRAG